MSRLPTLKAKDLIKILSRLGFQEIRQRGSHKFFQHPDGRTTVVPFHPGEDISRALLKEILKDIQITEEEFFKLIKKK
jgi:predicted RNA binding protein YcfA (HicA-like mRNA interferase family)